MALDLLSELAVSPGGLADMAEILPLLLLGAACFLKGLPGVRVHSQRIACIDDASVDLTDLSAQLVGGRLGSVALLVEYRCLRRCGAEIARWQIQIEEVGLESRVSPSGTKGIAGHRFVKLSRRAVADTLARRSRRQVLILPRVVCQIADVNRSLPVSLDS